jgi:hypothetical protein
MNGQQIECVLEQIDDNVGLARDEAEAYIRQNRTDLISALVKTGHAEIKTSGGNFTITLADLGALAA